MSQNVNHCPFCGSAIEGGAQFCPNCGASISGDAGPSKPAQPAYSPPPPQESYGTTPAYQQPTTTVYTSQRQDDNTGLISLIFGILGCVGILTCIGPIVAIVLGNQAKRKGETQYSQIGLILGYIGLVLHIIGIVFVIVFYVFFPMWWYL